MKITILSLTFFFTLVCSKSTLGQQIILDSLENELFLNKTNIEKTSLLKADLAKNIRFTNLPKALQLITEALGEVRKSNNYKNAVLVYVNATRVFKQVDSIRGMINASDSAILFAKKSKDITINGIALWNRGYVQEILNESEKSIENYFKALKLLDKSEEWVIISDIYYKIYGHFADINELANEDKYARLCLSAAIKSDNAEKICVAWQSMAINYSQLFAESKNRTLADSAIFAYKKSLEIFKANSARIIGQNQLGIFALNTADFYFQNFMPAAKDSVIKYLEIAIENGKTQTRSPILNNSYGLLSELAIQEKNFPKAEALLLKSMEFSEKETYRNLPSLQIVYLSLANFYSNRNNNSKALEFYKKYVKIYSELNSANRQKDTRKFEALFDSEKKAQQLELEFQKTSSEKKQKIIFALIALCLFIIIVFGFRIFHLRLKNSLKETNNLQLQKAETALENKLQAVEYDQLLLKKQDAELRAQLQEEQTKLKTEEAARLVAEQKLVEVQKDQLQKQLMASELQIEHKIEILQNLKYKINENNNKDKSSLKMQHIIDDAMSVDEDFEQFKIELKEINPTFFNLLQQKSQQKLTSLDLRYCAYIFMKFPTKQMANLLNVEATTIRMNKYRIKQKIGLTKDQDLNTFISNII